MTVAPQRTLSLRWNRFRGACIAMRCNPPEVTIDPSENAVSIDAAIAMRVIFAQDSRAVRALFDALMGIGAGVSLACGSLLTEVAARRCCDRRPSAFDASV